MFVVFARRQLCVHGTRVRTRKYRTSRSPRSSWTTIMHRHRNASPTASAMAFMTLARAADYDRLRFIVDLKQTFWGWNIEGLPRRSCQSGPNLHMTSKITCANFDFLISSMGRYGQASRILYTSAPKMTTSINLNTDVAQIRREVRSDICQDVHNAEY